ncbi:MAG: branched-chain amino acid ABC transporter permease [Microthrixaceae bacterium]
MQTFLQLLVSGLQNGVAYGLVGLSLVLIYQTSRALNFAQGTMAAMSGYVAYEVIVSMGAPWVVGAIVGTIAGGVLGLGIERVAIRPLLGAPLLSLVIATLAVDSIFGNVTQLVWGSDVKSLPPIAAGDYNVGGVIVGRTYAVIGAVTVVLLIGLAYLLKRTRMGLAMRAFADDQFAAELQGIKLAQVSRTVWFIAAAIGGITGVLFGPLLFIQLGYMNPIFIKGFTAAVLGGFVSSVGAVVGGLALGVLEALAIRYTSTSIAPMLPLLVILVAMLSRPSGVFNRKIAVRHA